MEKQRLSNHLYEARAPFAVQYSIEGWPSGKRKARQRGSREPGDAPVGEEVGTWATVLIGAELVDGDPGAVGRVPAGRSRAS